MIEIWTDGSCDNSDPMGIGGAAAVVIWKNKIRVLSESETNSSSQRMEVHSIFLGLNAIKPNYDVTLYNDSQIPVDILNGVKKAVKNKDLYNKVFDLVSKFKSNGRKIVFVWIPKDSHEYNKTCHQVANIVRKNQINRHKR